MGDVMGTVSSVHYKGKLHLGYTASEDQSCKRLGCSVDTYNNFITQFFMKLFSLAITVYVDGKDRCVNKKDLLEHLKSIGIANPTIEKTNKIIYYNLIASHIQHLTLGDDNLGAILPHSVRLKYSKKMINAIEQNAAGAVKRYLDKGAYYDIKFYKAPRSPIKGKHIWLNRVKIESKLFHSFANAYYFSYTPLSLAIDNGNQEMARYIHRNKGNTDADIKATYHLFAAKITKWEAERRKCVQAKYDENSLEFSFKKDKEIEVNTL